jgi:predicted transcriptional regulator
MMSNAQDRSNTPTPFDVQRQLADLLPSSWRVELVQRDVRRGPDAVLWIEAPNGLRATLLLEIKRRIDPVSVPRVLEQMQSWTGRETLDEDRAAYLLAAPYLSERTQERLRDNDLSYLDLTGNVLLQVDEPSIYVRSRGASKNPYPSSRPRRSLRGARTAQIVRTLVDTRPPLGVRQIAELSDSNPGNVSRVLDLLEREDLIARSPQGGVEDVRWDELLEAWSRDYSLTDSNRYSTYLDPRGLDNLISNLRSLPSGLRYAVTGSLAAARIAPVAPSRSGAVFVDDAAAVADALGLKPADAGANVLLLEPKGDFVFDGARLDDGVRYVAPSQAVADLLSGSGRNPAEAEELLSWMRRNEDAWRA